VVQCNVVGRDLRSTVQEIEQRVGQALKLPQGYRIEYGGQFESLERAYQRLTLRGIGVIVGIFLILGTAFGYYKDALIIMLNLPFGLGWRRGRPLPRRRRSFSRSHCWVYHAVWYGYAQRHY
jgi:Cu/Ag efflux pump CusA